MPLAHNCWYFSDITYPIGLVAWMDGVTGGVALPLAHNCWDFSDITYPIGLVAWMDGVTGGVALLLAHIRLGWYRRCWDGNFADQQYLTKAFRVRGPLSYFFYDQCFCFP